MKKTLVLAILLTLVVVGLQAHAASSVRARYNPETLMLTVTFDHTVRDTADHHIATIIVKVNGAEALIHRLPVQEAGTGGNQGYKMPGIKTGDVISIETECNKGGRRSTQITAP